MPAHPPTPTTKVPSLCLLHYVPAESSCSPSAQGLGGGSQKQAQPQKRSRLVQKPPAVQLLSPFSDKVWGLVCNAPHSSRERIKLGHDLLFSLGQADPNCKVQCQTEANMAAEAWAVRAQARPSGSSASPGSCGLSLSSSSRPPGNSASTSR